MKTILLVLAICFVSVAVTRIENSKVIVPDTVTTKVRNDTLKFVVYDTLKIKTTLKDTTLVMKIDTVKSSSKPVQVVAPVIKK
jgi:hypothetical protein